MTTSPGSANVESARRHGDDFARTPQFEWLARAGLVAHGVVYGVIGLLAIRLAFGVGGKTADQAGALHTIARQPFGKGLLILTAIGLAAYATWRLVRAAIGHGPEASDSTLDRVAGVASGVVHAALALIAVTIIVGAGSGSRSGGTADKATGGVLGWPAGRWLVGLGGLVFIGVAVHQSYKGLARKFLEDSKTGEMTEGTRTFFTAIGTAGHVARGVVFALIGYFLLKAAISFDADQAIGLDGALAKLGQAAYGPILLGIVAAGLLAFAAFSIVDARYRKV